MPRLAFITAWTVVLGSTCAISLGCRTLSQRGPVSQSVATCRQLTQQGVNAMERGDWKRAESLLGRAVETSSTDPDARRSYAEALCHRGESREALAHLEQARQLQGDDPALLVRMGELHLALGGATESERMAQEALRADPRFAPAWALRGKIATARGDHASALVNLQRSLGYAPRDPQITLLVAETYRHLNEPQRALGTLQSLADTYSPGREPQRVLYLQGLALGALGRQDDAVEQLSLAARRESPSAEILWRLAEAEASAGRINDARRSLAQALALDPQHAPSRSLAGRLTPGELSGATIRR